MSQTPEQVTNGGGEVMAASLTSEDAVAPSTDENEAIRPAQLQRALDGDIVTVAVILTGADLKRLGINPTKTDAVRPRIQSGVVLIEAV